MLRGGIVYNPIYGHTKFIPQGLLVSIQKIWSCKNNEVRRCLVLCWWSVGHMSGSRQWSSPQADEWFWIATSLARFFAQHLFYLGARTLRNWLAGFWLNTEDLQYTKDTQKDFRNLIKHSDHLSNSKFWGKQPGSYEAEVHNTIASKYCDDCYWIFYWRLIKFCEIPLIFDIKRLRDLLHGTRSLLPLIKF